MSSAWYVNTNNKYCNNECINNMLKENIICAYGDAMTDINSIKIGDIATNAKHIDGVNEQPWVDETRALKVSWLDQYAVSFKGNYLICK